MKLAETDVHWLRCFFPSLAYDPEAQKISGELSFCACYEKATGKVNIELLERHEDVRRSDSFLCDVFEIEILLNPEEEDSNGWPRVMEVGGRKETIAKECGVPLIDLHFDHDGCCCLGISRSRDPDLRIGRFLHQRVVPFFYRLSYAERFGIAAARNDLWGEYAHGDSGFRQHRDRMLAFARRDPGRNTPCPCGSGAKYKKCCLDEVRAVVERETMLKRPAAFLDT